MRIDAFHLPADLVAGAPLEPIVERDGVTVQAPTLSADAIGTVCDRLLVARARLLDVPVARIIAAVDAAARRLRDPGQQVRHDILRALAAVTGYSPTMAALVLDRMSDDWLAPALEQLITAELGGTDALDGFITRAPRSRSRAVGLPLGLHVFAGNVPGVSVTSIVRALLVRSAVLGKCAAGEPALAPTFARLLAEADPLVGACAAVTYWRGGDEDIERAALARAHVLVHYGGRESAASLRARAPAHIRIVDHGPRVSCAVVFASADGESLRQAARDTAHAIALFDQQGCVSPQFVAVIGEQAHALGFADRLAAALQQVQTELPRGRLDAGEAAAVHALRSRAEFRAIAGEPVALWAGDDLAFTVICEPDGELSGSCLNRTIVVAAVPSLDALVSRLEPLGHYLQTVGFAGADDPQTLKLATRMAEIGATRVTPIRDMPFPPVAWHHDGSGPLRELVRWVDLEA